MLSNRQKARRLLFLDWIIGVDLNANRFDCLKKVIAEMTEWGGPERGVHWKHQCNDLCILMCYALETSMDDMEYVGLFYSDFLMLF
nr:hypothetical protein Iba_chr09aCG7340 [Ipomoea batatas]